MNAGNLIGADDDRAGMLPGDGIGFRPSELLAELDRREPPLMAGLFIDLGR